MRELFTMWRSTRMIVLTAISAAAYVAVLLPFKGFVIIPGLTEVRPGAALPVVLSFLFGPAAAWGAAFGNLIADVLGGMLTPGSIFGFIGNFLFGYLPYAMWRAYMGYTSPIRGVLKGWVWYVVILLTVCLVIGSVIGWGVDLLKLAPFAALGLIIAVNNFIAVAIIATILIALLYSRMETWGLLYFQVMEETPEELVEDESGELVSRPAEKRPQPYPSRLALIGALICIAGAVIAFFAGLFISAEALQVGYGAAGFASEAKGSLSVAVGMLPGLILIVIGSIMQ